MSYSTYFYKNAGLPLEQASNSTMIQYALGLVGTTVSLALIARFGRRTLYTCGLAALFGILLIIGELGFAPASEKAVAWVVGSVLLVFTLVYNATMGAVCYALVAEMSSTRLR